MTDEPATGAASPAPEPGASHPAQAADVDTRLPWGLLLVLGLQHVLAMYAGAVAVPLLVGTALGFSPTQQAFLIRADLFTCGLATLLQALGIGRHIGIRMPVLLGVSFVAVGPVIAIGKHLGIEYVYGAIICSGLLIAALSGQVRHLLRFFPPVVSGSVVTIIGVSLFPVAMNWAAGGIGAADYGSPRHLLLALFVLAVITLLQRLRSGFLSTISVLLGLLAGALVAAALGRMSLAGVRAEPWLAVPTPFWFGIPKLHGVAILTMSLVAIVCMVESLGVFFAVGKIVGRELGAEDLARGLRAEGVAMVLGGCFNSFPYTTYGQNAGLVALTGVRSRYVVAMAGAILVVLGLLPRFAALAAAVPAAVLGGAGVVMFGMIAASGIRMLAAVDLGDRRNLFVVAVAVGLGLGVSMVPQSLALVPGSVKWIFTDGIVIGTLTAVLLNSVLRWRRPQ